MIENKSLIMKKVKKDNINNGGAYTRKKAVEILIEILNNKKPLSFLRTYDSERKKAITNIFNESKKSTLFMSPPTNGYKLMQNAVLSLSIKNSFCRSLINPRQSKAEKYDFEYKKFSYKDK